MDKMSDSEINRRSMLRNVVGSIAACSGFAMQSAAAEPDLAPVEAEGTVEFERGSIRSQLNSLGVITDARRRPGPVEHSAENPLKSETLFEKMVTDGLIDQASIEVLPIRKLNGGNEGYYHIRVDDHKEVGFILHTPSGKLQVKFDEKIPPIAFLLPNNGKPPVEYTPRRDGGYQSNTMSKSIASSSDSSDDQQGQATGCDEFCVGCTCNWSIFCPAIWSMHIKCRNCWKGECIITDNCVTSC